MTPPSNPPGTDGSAVTSLSDPSGSPTAPPRVPGYELREEVGRGGMGVVYRADDPAFGREVAVKLLKNEGPADSPAARRFRAEARITGQLDHPGIPAAHQVGELADGRPFLVLRLIRGRTLDDLLRARPDPAHDRGRFLAVFEAVCQAVGYAHSKGVIHRDLKPVNVMVGAFGEVQVMDWGLAKEMRSAEFGTRNESPDVEADPASTPNSTLRTPHSDHTQPGSLLGTPAYMSPEQAAGAADRIDRRSDVFGLGAVLAVILTGRPPYTGTELLSTHRKALDAKLDDCLARLAGCGAEPELVALCKRCLSVDPKDRPADAGVVAAEVAGLRTAAEDRARKAEVTAATARVRRRWLAALAAIGAAAAVVAGGYWWQAEKRQLADDAAARRYDVIARLTDPLARLVAVEAARRADPGRAPAVDRANLNRGLADAMVALDQFAPDDPAVPLAVRRVLAHSAYILGTDAVDKKQPADADRLLAQAAGWYATAVALDPADDDSRNQYANALYTLGVIARDAGRKDDHRRWWEASQAVSERLAADRPAAKGYTDNLGRMYFNLAQLELDEKHKPAARERLTQAIDTLRPAVKPGQPAAWFFSYAHAHRGALRDKGSDARLDDFVVAARWAESPGDRKEILAELADELPADAPPGRMVKLARVYAAAAVAAGPKGIDRAEYVTKAFELLKQARAAGLTPDAADWQPVRTDPLFEPVSKQPGFKELDPKPR